MGAALLRNPETLLAVKRLPLPHLLLKLDFEGTRATGTLANKL